MKRWRTERGERNDGKREDREGWGEREREDRKGWGKRQCERGEKEVRRGGGGGMTKRD